MTIESHSADVGSLEDEDEVRRSSIALLSLCGPLRRILYSGNKGIGKSLGSGDLYKPVEETARMTGFLNCPCGEDSWVVFAVRTASRTRSIAARQMSGFSRSKNGGVRVALG